MIPLRDSVRSRRRPLVTLALIAANVYVFLQELALPEPALMELFYRYGVVPARVGTPGEVLGHLVAGRVDRLLPLVTATFLHGGWLHLGGNMLYLWVFADNVEDRLGRLRFLLFYLLAGVLANYAQVLVAPSSTVPLVGASGAVAGVLGAYFVTFPRARVLALVPLGLFLTVTEVPAVIFLFLWFGLQLLSGVASLGVPAAGGVAWWAHVGGFVVGAALIRLFGVRPRPYPF